MSQIRIQLRRGTAALWASVNPILASGEEGYETDTGERKVGDGVTAWNALAYSGGGGAVESVNGQTGDVVLTAASVGADASGSAAAAQAAAISAAATDATTKANAAQAAAIAAAATDATTKANAAQAAAISAAATDATTKANAAQAAAISAASTDATTKANAAQAAAIAAAATDATTKANAAQAGAQSYADGLVVGLLDDRGNFDASGNLFPSTGGSGSAGAILKGDLWTISVAGTLGGKAVTVGDVIRALVNTPGQTAGNWVQTENNFGYVAENSANKVTALSGASTDVQYPSAKAVFDELANKASSSSLAGLSITVATKAPSASPTFTGDHAISQAAFSTGVISPAQLTANTNDWAPTGFSTCSEIRFSTDQPRKITSLAGGAAGRVVTLHNIGTKDAIFTNEDAAGTAANRFIVGQTFILQGGRSARVWYDGTAARWRLIGAIGRRCTQFLAADVANAEAVANTLTDVTGLTLQVVAGLTYRFRFAGQYTSAATGTGSRWTISGPATTYLHYQSEYSLSSSTTSTRNTNQTAYELPAAANATSSVVGAFVVEGVITPSADGTIQLRFASEVSASAITAKGGLCGVEYEVIP